MNQPKVSVIVAVFNAEKTLDRLCQSLVSQTMTDFEVLLIDDGSTDASGAVCDKYAGLDSRFKAFHKSNEGIGSTRQFGIDHAAGEYTIHADSDDWVEPDYLQLLYNEALSSDSDMVICDIVVNDGRRHVINKEQPSAFDMDSMIEGLLQKLQNGPCNKLIRRSFYVDRNITYDSSLSAGEDQLFNLQLIMSGAKVSYVPKALYHYDIVANPDSASRGSSLEKIRQGELFVGALSRLLPDRFQYIIDSKCLIVAYTAIKYEKLTDRQFREKFAYLSRVRWKDYYKISLPIKIITWTAVNVSYRLALFLYDIKKTVRRLKQY